MHIYLCIYLTTIIIFKLSNSGFWIRILFLYFFEYMALHDLYWLVGFSFLSNQTNSNPGNFCFNCLSGVKQHQLHVHIRCRQRRGGDKRATEDSRKSPSRVCVVFHSLQFIVRRKCDLTCSTLSSYITQASESFITTAV